MTNTSSTSLFSFDPPWKYFAQVSEPEKSSTCESPPPSLVASTDAAKKQAQDAIAIENIKKQWLQLTQPFNLLAHQYTRRLKESCNLSKDTPVRVEFSCTDITHATLLEKYYNFCERIKNPSNGDWKLSLHEPYLFSKAQPTAYDWSYSVQDKTQATVVIYLK